MKTWTHIEACPGKSHARPRTKGIDELPKLKLSIRFLAILILPLLHSGLVQREMTGEDVECGGLVFQARQLWSSPEQIKNQIFEVCVRLKWTYSLRTRKSSSWRPWLPTRSLMTEDLKSSSLGWQPKGSNPARSGANETERLVWLGGKLTTAIWDSSSRSVRRSDPLARFALFLGGSTFASLALISLARFPPVRAVSTCCDLLCRAATNAETLVVWVARHFFDLAACLEKHPAQNRPCPQPHSTGLPQAGACLDDREMQPPKAVQKENWVFCKIWIEVVTAGFAEKRAYLSERGLWLVCGHLDHKLAPLAILQVLGDVVFILFGLNDFHIVFSLWHDLWQVGRARAIYRFRDS